MPSPASPRICASAASSSWAVIWGRMSWESNHSFRARRSVESLPGARKGAPSSERGTRAGATGRAGRREEGQATLAERVAERPTGRRPGSPDTYRRVNDRYFKGRATARAELLLPAGDLAASLAFFSELGFALESTFPAAAPPVAVLP